MNAGVLAQLGIACAIFIAGAAGAKSWAVAPAPWKVVLTLLLYTAGNLLMLRLVRLAGMATAFSLSAVLQLVAANLLAILVFGERVSAVQGVGLGLAVLAVALVTLG